MGTKVKKEQTKGAVTKAPKKEVAKKKNESNEIDDIFNKKKITDTSEIDDIFNKKSVKKSKNKKESESESEEAEEDEEEEELTEEQTKKVEEVVFAELAAIKSTKKNTKKRPAPAADDGDFGDSRGLKKTNRYTDDGYPLYDVKDLNIGNGLDTADCPFDCQCCF